MYTPQIAGYSNLNKESIVYFNISITKTKQKIKYKKI